VSFALNRASALVSSKPAIIGRPMCEP